ATTTAASHPTGRSVNINTNNNRRELGPLQAVALGPVQVVVPMASVAKRGSAWSVMFRGRPGKENTHIQRGRTGKVVPRGSTTGEEPWRELIKARIHDAQPGYCVGELHAPKKGDLILSLDALTPAGVVLEVDRFGAAAKVESALTEVAFERQAIKEGFMLWRMPEDTAAHLGVYARYDFHVLDPSTQVARRFELKSLWGTNTEYARLISSKTTTNPTSSPRFDAQDFFAVNLWLRTGRVTDIAFARSRKRDDSHRYGLPHTPAHPDHVNQNPLCQPGDGIWFSLIRDVWDLP
ncbi:MAG: hypothetical protein M3Y17_03220, partial [Actinomycetota bacterium]|nr:hypothetical protein [Actinomycetota bacterium]